ncbi:ABC transporter domain-containing protein [Heracleum sosnowskyi]|uniref:ABC transporter domain-containing protein n=1 Tax=Heracleum sosnowskyi TaxID=360622 RepID=A0AAD8M209_9APIA|nr:ABC transporter domain-containing protein [Heracleum sosnowskyi]
MASGAASFWTQPNALLRKNLTFQKRNMGANVRLILFPLVLCFLLVLLQTIINNQLDKASNKCGCTCIHTDGDGRCQKVCGLQYSSIKQSFTCPIPSPPEWPPLLRVPAPEYRALITDFSHGDLPSKSCKVSGACPATILITGKNSSLGHGVSENMFKNTVDQNFSSNVYSLANTVLGTESHNKITNFLEPAFFSNSPVYYLQSKCAPNSTFPLTILEATSVIVQQEASCVQGLQFWRNTSSDINDELYKGYWKGNSGRKINEIIAGYDLLNSDVSNFNVGIWYNSTIRDNTGKRPIPLLRVPGSVNLVSSAYLQFLLGPAANLLFDFVKEMPKPETQLRLDFASLLGPLFFTWVILQLFPVVLSSLVYEKEQNLRIMMKMHGLGDGPYWMITYAYFLVISSVYMLAFVIFGSVVGLKFFTLNDYSIQFVFYLIYVNLQISLAFLVAAVFSNLKTATVIGYILIFGTGLLGAFLFQSFVEDESFPRGWVIVMELYPGFSLYRGLYEFSYYAINGFYLGIDGMQWKDLSAGANGMKEILVIMFVEWLVVLSVAYYVDQVVASGSGVGRNPLYFLEKLQKKPLSLSTKTSLQRQRSQVSVQMEKQDILQEKVRVKQLLLEQSTSHSVVCDDLLKIYPGRDGNPEKIAVRGLSLALPQGECFGMLGPNGAGKTSFINMMIGLIRPTSGTAYVEGLDIRTNMDGIYSNMGVCPQHDLLWNTLTGREHLLFYGRLKNLKGSALTQAVEESLKSVGLFNGGVADKQAGNYSGGMKRRLSVAISLIGNPKVVYMDEPSTGLDPASRNNLWNAVKQAKKNRAIFLTTHSMEEAEHLCDRLGIFVDGSFQCIGNPNELKARYGGSYVFTMTTSSNHEEEVENLVKHLSPSANRIYHISGTQKFELPKKDVRIADVFQAVEKAKIKFTVHAWGLTDTTLEDVFIKVARGAQAFHVLS